MEKNSSHIQGVRRRALAPIIVIVVIAGLAVAAFPSVERFFLKRDSLDGETTLRIAVEGLSATLDRFEPLPKLIAERPILVDLLKDPANEGLRPFVNEQLRLTAMSLGVSDVYLMDLGGTTIAASSYRKELSFVGRNFAFRPYFQQAVEGGLGRYFAMGTTSGERGYFFAAPVLDNTRVVGVIAIKFAVDTFEEAWRGGTSDIIVTDLADVIFMSSRPEWQFRTLGPLTGTDIARISENRQYPLDRLIPLDIGRTSDDVLTRIAVDGESFVANETLLNSVGWTITHLTPTAPARTQAILTLLVVGLALLLTWLGGRTFIDRRARARERLDAQRRANEQLEHQVAMRTDALNTVNAQLLSEIDDRKATEFRLRQTQKELVQAGKLAALGQMSAALSHEINQPLTAVKAYADNASVFLARNRVEDAAANVAQISKMADRMASLSGHLRNFARRPQDTVGDVDLSAIVADALELMDVRIQSSKTVVTTHGLERPVRVRGGQIRLQQVIVNLIANAVDAMQGIENPSLSLRVAFSTDNRVDLVIADNGPGLSGEVQDQIFDPFFTTKGPSQGLGLGLSISYNIVEDFGGHLKAANGPTGGAEFTVSLLGSESESSMDTVAAQ